jgi:hypothetical protein
MRLLRLFRLFPAAGALLISPAVMAQHSTAPTHASTVTSHVSSAPSSSVHSSVTSSAHPVGTTLHPNVVRGTQSMPKKNTLNAQRSQGNISPVSSTNSEPLKVHHFLFFRRHKPEKPRISYAIASAKMVRPSVLPVVPNRHFGCSIAAVPSNSGIPCTVYSPCCP